MNKIIEMNAKEAMTNKQFLEREINKWKTSTKRKLMITGENYYLGEHDILDRKRTVIGEGGALQEVTNLPNNKQIDNQYAKMVDQKVNYLLGKPITLGTDNKQYEVALQKIFNKKFHRMLKNIGENALNCGICWLHPYYNEFGELCLKRFDGYEILPFWKDAEHTVLEFAIRLYEVQGYDGKREVTIEKVEVYTSTGIDRYILSKGSLIKDVDSPSSSYILVEDKPYTWNKIPLIPFKYNHKELPLIKHVKCLQDGINVMLSDFQNNMQEDARNTILVIKNYDGENLAEFRHNLATYGAVKVKTVDGADGGIDTLTVEINSENYKTILHIFKNALIENAKGYDAKDDRLMQGTPNQMNIQSMYSDIDLDANGMETEFQASFEDLIWFVNVHLVNNGEGNFENEEVEIIFNRDILINESESIDNCQTSVGILSTETIVSQHPWVSDVEQELERLKKEKEEMINDLYSEAFNPVGDNEDEE
jgi:SPP1 family phage portal protein